MDRSKSHSENCGDPLDAGEAGSAGACRTPRTSGGTIENAFPTGHSACATPHLL